jgi:hypothetical protein
MAVFCRLVQIFTHRPDDGVSKDVRNGAKTQKTAIFVIVRKNLKPSNYTCFFRFFLKYEISVSIIYPSIYLSIHMYVIYIPIYVSFTYLSIFIHLSNLFTYIYLSINLSIYLSSIYPYVSHLSNLSICLPLYVCVSIKGIKRLRNQFYKDLIFFSLVNKKSNKTKIVTAYLLFKHQYMAV